MYTTCIQVRLAPNNAVLPCYFALRETGGIRQLIVDYVYDARDTLKRRGTCKVLYTIPTCTEV